MHTLLEQPQQHTTHDMHIFEDWPVYAYATASKLKQHDHLLLLPPSSPTKVTTNIQPDINCSNQAHSESSIFPRKPGLMNL
jgi:hypothetical protein